MMVRIAEEPFSALADYAGVPIAFEAKHVMDVGWLSIAGGPFVLAERPLTTPFLKDYDAFPNEAPTNWPSRFDLSASALFAAHSDGARVGGAAVLMRSNDVELLEGRGDLALLWDIRVAPAARRQGVGGALLHAVESWARDRGTACIKVETQDVNVPACRFYLRHGFELRAAHANAYPEPPREAQLLWYKELIEGGAGSG